MGEDEAKKPEGEVAQEMQKLRSAIGCLEMCVTTLLDRIAPVLSAPGKKLEESKPVDTPIGSKLAADIRDDVKRIYAQSELLTEVANHVEL